MFFAVYPVNPLLYLFHKTSHMSVVFKERDDEDKHVYLFLVGI